MLTSQQEGQLDGYSFSTPDDVKQGRVLSTVLFGIHGAELEPRLSHSGYGCKIDHTYPGAVGCAAVVTGVALSISCMTKMREISLECAKGFNTVSNPSKCQFISDCVNNNDVLNFNGTDMESETKMSILVTQ